MKFREWWFIHPAEYCSETAAATRAAFRRQVVGRPVVLLVLRADVGRRCDFRFDLADRESGSAATRPASATNQQRDKSAISGSGARISREGDRLGGGDGASAFVAKRSRDQRPVSSLRCRRRNRRSLVGESIKGIAGVDPGPPRIQLRRFHRCHARGCRAVGSASAEPPDLHPVLSVDDSAVTSAPASAWRNEPTP